MSFKLSQKSLDKLEGTSRYGEVCQKRHRMD